MHSYDFIVLNLTSRQENTQVQLLAASKLDARRSGHGQVKIFTDVLIDIISEKKTEMYWPAGQLDLNDFSCTELHWLLKARCFSCYNWKINL